MDILPLIVGITSSLIATALFVVGSEIFRKIVLPWWADHIYRGVRIDGHWELSPYDPDVTLEPEEDRIKMTMDLTQKGDTIQGTVTIEDSESKTPLLYKISGVIKDAYFTAYGCSLSAYAIDPITLHFKVMTFAGHALVGSLGCTTTETGEVTSKNGVCFRRSQIKK